MRADMHRYPPISGYSASLPIGREDIGRRNAMDEVGS
jgi:hypothetical protein